MGKTRRIGEARRRRQRALTLSLGATWMFHRNYGLGLGYNYFTSNLDVAKSDFNGQLKLGYSGVQAYLTGTF
jgi:long-subunit fatty acid transport protein